MTGKATFPYPDDFVFTCFHERCWLIVLDLINKNNGNYYMVESDRGLERNSLKANIYKEDDNTYQIDVEEDVLPEE